jgi:hypothetical protein
MRPVGASRAVRRTGEQRTSQPGIKSGGDPVVVRLGAQCACAN